MTNLDHYKTINNARKAYDNNPKITGLFKKWLNQDYDPLLDQPEVLFSIQGIEVCKGPSGDNDERTIHIRENDHVCIIVKKDSRILLERRFNPGKMTSLEGLICGEVLDDETPAHAASRVLKQKTGYEVERDDFTYLGKLSANPMLMTCDVHYFFIELVQVDDFGRSNYEMTDPEEKVDFYWRSQSLAIDNLLETGNSTVYAGAWMLMLNNKLKNNNVELRDLLK